MRKYVLFIYLTANNDFLEIVSSWNIIDCMLSLFCIFKSVKVNNLKFIWFWNLFEHDRYLGFGHRTSLFTV